MLIHDWSSILCLVLFPSYCVKVVEILSCRRDVVVVVVVVTQLL